MPWCGVCGNKLHDNTRYCVKCDRLLKKSEISRIPGWLVTSTSDQASFLELFQKDKAEELTEVQTDETTELPGEQVTEERAGKKRTKSQIVVGILVALAYVALQILGGESGEDGASPLLIIVGIYIFISLLAPWLFNRSKEKPSSIEDVE